MKILEVVFLYLNLRDSLFQQCSCFSSHQYFHRSYLNTQTMSFGRDDGFCDQHEQAVSPVHLFIRTVSFVASKGKLFRIALSLTSSLTMSPQSPQALLIFLMFIFGDISASLLEEPAFEELMLSDDTFQARQAFHNLNLRIFFLLLQANIYERLIHSNTACSCFTHYRCLNR